MTTPCFNPANTDARDTQKKSSAISLSDMEVFVFPDLAYSLVLANILSPILWEWRSDPWFAGIQKRSPMAQVNRLRQFIMDNYSFNLDLETWGLTTQERELKRFADFVDRDSLAQSNALFGYEGDRYYFDIDIRTHFGLDKYTGDIIPYWKTETIEAMTAFRFKKGYTTGAGECVSLAALYAAALFVVLQIPLDKIYVTATPLHSQNFIDIGEGFLCNNRRIVTKTMWFNGTELSAQARRALENERVTLVAHETGVIHLLYPEATIDPQVYESFSAKLKAYLSTSMTAEMLGNFLRHSPERRRCFTVCWELHGSDHYIKLDRLFAYEQSSRFRITDASRSKLLEEVDQAEFKHSPPSTSIILNDLEEYLKQNPVDIHSAEDLDRLRERFDRGCLDSAETIEELIRFCHVEPRLPDAAEKTFKRDEPALGLTTTMSRDEIYERLQSLRDSNEMADLAFHAYRDLNTIDALPFLLAALQRNPVCLEESTELTDTQLIDHYAALPNESIYEGEGRLSQPDEVCNFARGDGLERILTLATIMRERYRDPDFTIRMENNEATLLHGDREICRFPTVKKAQDSVWPLAAIPLR